jgi:DNA-binding transcriptional ArsR family regulator
MRVPRPVTEDQLDTVFHALADRTRRRMLARLSEGSAMVSELAAPFDMSLSAVSQHLKVLESAELVTRNVEGRVHRCALAPAALRDAFRWLDHYQPFWDNALAALARYVEHPQPGGRANKRRRK